MIQRAQLLATRYRLRELRQRGEARALQQMALQALSAAEAADPSPRWIRRAARRVGAAVLARPAAAGPLADATTRAASAPANCCASPA